MRPNGRIRAARRGGVFARPITRRIADLVPQSAFRETTLYNDYRAIRAMAMPIYVNSRPLVSFVFNRARRPFSDPDRDRAELMRPQLAQLYRPSGAATPDTAMLTPREREVLEWLAAGKSNRDIAEIIGAKPRTVEKHLERVYEKLGVESRTAAVMRAYQS